MRYIRNVDTDLKVAVVQTHDMHGVVEVLGGLGSMVKTRWERKSLRVSYSFSGIFQG